MSWFNKRKEQNLIPPIESAAPGGASRGNTTSPRPPVRSAAATYVPSRDGDMYNSRSNSYNSGKSEPPGDGYSAPRDRYGRNAPVGDVYSRGEGDLDRDRNELFAGYNPQKAGGSDRFVDGPGLGREPPPGEENEEDIEGIKTQTRFLKQESVNSTRNALRMAREAEETARGTVTKLGDQSGKLCRSHEHCIWR